MREKEHNACQGSIVGLLAESEVKGPKSAVELLVGSKWWVRHPAVDDLGTICGLIIQ